MMGDFSLECGILSYLAAIGAREPRRTISSPEDARTTRQSVPESDEQAKSF